MTTPWKKISEILAAMKFLFLILKAIIFRRGNNICFSLLASSAQEAKQFYNSRYLRVPAIVREMINSKLPATAHM